MVAAPNAYAAANCTNGNGYRNCRVDASGDNMGDFISLTAYSNGVVEAGRQAKTNVWIDSNTANHLAHGNGLATYNHGAHGAKYRGCTWFTITAITGPKVWCTPWVQGY